MKPRKRGAPRRRAARRARATSLRSNPRGVSLAGAVLQSGRVYALEYEHAQSAQRAAYRHDFARGVEMWALPSGEILLRKPGAALHDTFTVPDDE